MHPRPFWDASWASLVKTSNLTFLLNLSSHQETFSPLPKSTGNPLLFTFAAPTGMANAYINGEHANSAYVDREEEALNVIGGHIGAWNG